MPNAAVRIEEVAAEALRTHSLGVVNVTTHPHHIENIGPFVLVTLDEHGAKYIVNLRPEKARLMAACLVAGACEAEALERAAKRQAEQRAAIKT